MKIRMAWVGMASLAAVAGIDVPDAAAMMKTKVPDVDIPDINVPKLPKNVVPDVDVPRVTTPNAPKVTAPAVNAPKVNAPAVNSPDVTAPRIATPEPPKVTVDPMKRPIPVPVDNAPKIATPDAPKLDPVDPMKRPMPVPAEAATTAVDPGTAKPKRVLPTPQPKAKTAGAAATTPVEAGTATPKRTLPTTPPKKNAAPAASDSASASTSSGTTAAKPADAKTPGKLKPWQPEATTTPVKADQKLPTPGKLKQSQLDAVAAPGEVKPAAAASDSASASTSTKAPKFDPMQRPTPTTPADDAASASTSTSARTDPADVQYGQLPRDKNYGSIPPEPGTADPDAPKAMRTGHGEVPSPRYDVVPDAPKQYGNLPPEPAAVDPNAPKSLPTGHAKLPAQINYGKVPDLGGTPPEVKATPARKLGETVGANPGDIAKAEKNKLGQVAAPGLGLPDKPKAAVASADPAVKQPKRMPLSNDNAEPAAAAVATPAKPPKSSKLPLPNDAPAQVANGGAVRQVQQMPAPQAVASAAPSVTPNQIVGRRQLRPVQGGAVNGAASSSTGVAPPDIRKFY